MAAMLDPIPWQPENDGPLYQTAPLAALAQRIHALRKKPMALPNLVALLLVLDSAG